MCSLTLMLSPLSCRRFSVKYTSPYPVDSGLMSEPPYDSLRYKDTYVCSARPRTQPVMVARHY